MVQSIKTAADAVLNKAVSSTPGVPGVVAVATDRNANIYEGAFGVRQAGAQRRDDDRQRLRHFLDHQGDYRHGVPSVGGRRQAGP